MKKKISSTFLFLIVLVLLVACRQATVEVKLFQASLELVSPSVKDGEDFTFRIYSNYSPFIVTYLSCPFETDVIEPGISYSTNDAGYTTFTIPEVKIKSSGRQTLKITVKAQATGKTIELEQSFNAFQNDKISIILDSEPASEKQTEIQIKDVPLIVSGTNVTMSVFSTYKRLTLNSFVCDFNTNTLKKGMNMEFDEDGFCELLFENVNVKDNYTKASEIKLTFQSPENPNDKIESEPMKYVSISQMKCSLKIVTPRVITGGNFEAEINSNRNCLYVMDIKSSVFKKGSTNTLQCNGSDLEKGKAITSTNGKYILSGTVETTEDIVDLLSIELSDNYYSGEDYVNEISDKWELLTKKGATNIAVDKTNIILDKFTNEKYPTSETIKITTTDTSSDGIYSWYEKNGKDNEISVSIETDSDKLNATAKIEARNEGEYTIVFHPGKKKDVTAEVKVIVRYVVGLRIDEIGKFYQFSNGCGHMRCKDGLGSRYEADLKNGLISFPEKITATIVKWSSTETNLEEIPIDNADTISLYTFTKDCGRFSVKMKFESQNVETSRFFYGKLHSADVQNWQNYYIDLSGSEWAQEGHRKDCIKYDMDNMVSSYPTENNMIHNIPIEAYATTNQMINLEKTLAYMQNISSFSAITNQYGSWGTSTNYETKIIKPNWGKVKLEVSSIEYDETRLNMKYIFYMSKVSSYKLQKEINAIIKEQKDNWSSYYGVIPAPTGYYDKIVYKCTLPWWRNITCGLSQVTDGTLSRTYDASPNKWVVEYKLN